MWDHYFSDRLFPCSRCLEINGFLKCPRFPFDGTTDGWEGGYVWKSRDAVETRCSQVQIGSEDRVLGSHGGVAEGCEGGGIDEECFCVFRGGAVVDVFLWALF